MNEHYGELQDESYNKGLEDAWELARRLNLLGWEILEKIYGIYKMPVIFTKFTPQETIAKLEAYEKSKVEIKVGDIVETTALSDVFKGAVLDFKDGTENEVVVLNENGCVDVWKIADCKKTGKHIDIQSVLQQICK